MDKISITLIIVLIANANTYSKEKFRVGDTVYVSNRDRRMNSKVNDIFNGFDGSKYIKDEVYNNENYTLIHDSCLLFESMKEKFHPDVLVAEKIIISASSNVFYHMNNWEYKYLGVNDQYINNDHYRYGLVKICKTLGKQSLHIDLIDTPDFLRNDENTHYKVLLRKTAIFRLRQNNETHYVSSILTGTCLVQIFVNDVAKCTKNKGRSTDDVVDFFKSSIVRSPIMTVDMNSEITNEINLYYFLNNIDYSLFAFPDERNHQNNILLLFKNNEIVSIKLRPLPELPASARFSPTQVSYPLKTWKKRNDIIPGDVINLDHFLNSSSELVATRNILRYKNDGRILPYTYYNYSKCFSYKKNMALNFENGKLNVFDEMLKRRNSDVFPEFSDIAVTCMRMAICSTLQKEKLDSRMIIIKLDDNSKNNRRYNIFEDKDIILWFSKDNEDHLVTHVERGECVSQTIMYIDNPNLVNDRSIFDAHPIYMGKMFSATRNHSLEEQVKNFVKNDLRNILGRVKNASAIIKTFEELDSSRLTNNAVINLYLEELI